MGVRPPSNNDTDDPKSIDFGIAALDDRLRKSDLSFPATKTDVEEELGHKKIPYDVHGNDVRLSKILERVETEKFESRQELLNTLHHPFEQYRKENSGGVLGQVKSLLPF